MTSPIPLAEQIAAVKRAWTDVAKRAAYSSPQSSAHWEADRLAAALATLRGLQQRSET